MGRESPRRKAPLCIIEKLGLPDGPKIYEQGDKLFSKDFEDTASKFRL
jgi:hypothetical protein